MMRVGVLGHGFITWGGGVDFLRIVASSLLHAPEPVEVHLLLPTRGPRLLARNALRRLYRGGRTLLGQSLPPINYVDRLHIVELTQTMGAGIFVHEIDYGYSSIAGAARKLGLEALVPAITPLPNGFPVPWVGYLYDFQHRYYPEYFHLDECRRRDTDFTLMLTVARSVIVNARAVADDVADFHPTARARVFALPFSAAPLPSYLDEWESPAARYGIVRPYFIVCNQFWKHKDHVTLFAAFARIAQVCPEVDLVCTGATDDYRDPDYFPGLVRGLNEARIRERVHILGMVPKSDQIALLKGAAALVQPTLFEGGPGGGAVFDAVSLGVPCLVSDIAVNMELDEPEVSFFRARDPDALAQALVAVTRACPVPRDDAQTLVCRGHERRRRCGAVLLQAIREAQ